MKEPIKPKRTIKKGLSSSVQTSDRANATHAQSETSVNPNAGKRAPRVQMGKGLNLKIPGVILDKENYHYHWIDEQPFRPGKLEQAKAAYYEHVTDGEGKMIQRPSGAGVLYLMRLPIQYWREDLAAKKEKVQKTMDKEAALGANEYAPTERGDPDGGDSALISRKVSSSPYS